MKPVMSGIAMETPAVNPKLKRSRKVLNFTQGQLYGLFFGHLGKLSMVALYFIVAAGAFKTQMGRFMPWRQTFGGALRETVLHLVEALLWGPLTGQGGGL